MVNYISFIIVIIIMLISFKSFIFIVKTIKNADNLFEKTVYYSILFIIFVPIVLYLLDRFNLPSKFGYTINVNSSNWFTFISSYVGCILGSIISGIVLVGVTFSQIRRDEDRKKVETLEQRKANNMPILKYDIKFYEKKPNTNILIMDRPENNSDDGCLIALDIENIGLNTAKNIYCNMIIEDSKHKCTSVDKNFSIRESL